MEIQNGRADVISNTTGFRVEQGPAPGILGDAAEPAKKRSRATELAPVG